MAVLPIHGTIDKVVGAGSISAENSYYVRVYVQDAGGTTYSADILIPSQAYPIDVHKSGKGIAFGKTAETENKFDVNYAAQFRKRLDVDGGLYVKDQDGKYRIIDLTYDVVDTW